MSDGGRRRTASGSSVLLLLVALVAVQWAQAGTRNGGSGDPGRDWETVVVSGASLPVLWGLPVEDLTLFRYDPDTQAFVPVPMQVDERLLKVFNPGSPLEFSEHMYDVFGEEDGTLDADDEVVFLFRDAGEQAPVDAAWPENADPLRFEIAVQDPLPAGGEPGRWLYLYTGAGLPQSSEAYLTWDGLDTSSITTENFSVDYQGRWLFTGLRVASPCGDGLDLIDRFKGRAVPLADLEQDEEDWNLNSEYLGGIVGPVRAIRYVRGARSAVNTIHHDVITPDVWYRKLNIRVHVLAAVKFYLDWLPSAGAVFYTPDQPAGVSVDGIPDPEMGTAFVSWSVMKTTGGGVVALFEVPPSPLYDQKNLYYLDDAAYDDALAHKESYSDDDDAAFGNHGVVLLDLADSNLQAIPVDLTLFPICADTGGVGLVTSYQEKVSYPLMPDVIPQSDCGPVRTLAARREGGDLLLEWQAMPGAEAYRIYRADYPDLPPTSWTVAGETAALTYREEGGGATMDTRFYSVVCVQQGGEGPR